MTQNVPSLPLNFLMREFFVALGFADVKFDCAKRDQLRDLIVAGLNTVTPKTQEEREMVRELAQRLTQLKGEPTESLPAVMCSVPAQYDPEAEEHLMRQIKASRERVLRELDAQNQLLASRAAA